MNTYFDASVYDIRLLLAYIPIAYGWWKVRHDRSLGHSSGPQNDRDHPFSAGQRRYTTGFI